MKRLLSCCAAAGLMISAVWTGAAAGLQAAAEALCPELAASAYAAAPNAPAPTSDGALRLDSGAGTLTYAVEVPQAGVYQTVLEWQVVPQQKSDVDIVVTVQLNGGAVRAARLPRLWVDDGEPYVDRLGNEFAPNQKELAAWQSTRLYENAGAYTTPMTAELQAGHNELSLTVSSGELLLRAIRLTEYRQPPSYREYAAQHKGAVYDGPDIVLEGEAAVYKSDRFILPLSDVNTVSAKPASAQVGLLNYIGGSNWKRLGDTITWETVVPKTAWYRVGFHYRQSFSAGSVSYRQLTVNGEVPFSVCGSVAFPYNTGWEYLTLGTEDGETCLVYLEAGRNTLSLTVSLGDMEALCARLSEAVYELAAVYRDLRSVTGEAPDANRDYGLFQQIPDLERRLTDLMDELESLAQTSERLAQATGGSGAEWCFARHVRDRCPPVRNSAAAAAQDSAAPVHAAAPRCRRAALSARRAGRSCSEPTRTEPMRGKKDRAMHIRRLGRQAGVLLLLLCLLLSVVPAVSAAGVNYIDSIHVEYTNPGYTAGDGDGHGGSLHGRL